LVLLVAACAGGGGDDDDTPPAADAAAGADAPPGPDASPGADAPPGPDAPPAPDASGPDAPPNVAPGAPSNFTATPVAAAIDLAWQNPPDADLAGVILVRHAGSPVTASPLDGTTYTAGGTLGAGDQIVFVGNATSFQDTTATPGFAFYSLHALDGGPLYSAPATASAVMPTGPQLGMITVALTPAPTVTVNMQPAYYTLAGTATYDAGTGTLTVTLGVTSGLARTVFNPTLVLTATNQGTLASDGTLAGQPFRRLGGLLGLAPGGTLSPDLVLSGVDGTVDPVVLSVAIVDHPAVLVGGEWDTGGAYRLVDTGTMTEVGEAPCDTLVYAGGTNPNASSNCSHRSGALSFPAGRFFSGNRALPVVRVVDLATHATISSATLHTGDGSVDNVALSRGGTTLYAVLNRNVHAYAFSGPGGTDEAMLTVDIELVRLEAATLMETGRLTLVSGAAGDTRGRTVALSPDGTRAAVAVFGTGNVHLVDLATFTEIDTDAVTAGVQPISVGAMSRPRTVAFSPDGSALWVQFGRDTGDRVVRVDMSTFLGTDVAIGTTATRSGSLLILPDGRVVVLTRATAATEPDIVVLDAAGATLTTLDTGGRPAHAAAVSPDGQRLLVSLFAGDGLPASVRLYDVATLTPIDVDGDAANGQTDVSLGGPPGQHWLQVTPF
jgi:hypothetical protein